MTTDADGRFALPFLTPEPHSVHAELLGFKPIDRSDVQVPLGSTVELLLTMEVGAVTETVVVVSAAPTVDTTSTKSERTSRTPRSRGITSRHRSLCRALPS